MTPGTSSGEQARISTRAFVVAGVVAALLVAGVLSLWASSHPDGLEHVAEQVGFAEQAQESPTDASPLSDYQLRGVENDAVSGGLAGVVGALVVLVLAGGLAYVVRRRARPAQPDECEPEPLDQADRRS